MNTTTKSKCRSVLVRPHRVCVALLVTCLTASAAQSADCPRECDDVSIWARYTSIDLTLTSPESKDVTKWHTEFDQSNSDFKIDVDASTAGKRNRGTIGMIAGRTMIVKGLELQPGYEIDAVDGPILTMRLLLAVLTRTVPGGPDSLEGERKIDFREAKNGIRFSTPSASGYVTAPWRARGWLRKQPHDVIAYEVELTGGSQDPLGNKGEPVDMKFTGNLAARRYPVFEESMSLAGWKIFGVGPKKVERDGATTLDYGAKANPESRAGTVADVRAAIGEELSPGTPDPTRSFTGMWKTKCTEDFGLQIKPFGNDGKYSVSFCGPGGCFDPGAYRPNTFISGDRSYRVVSESEIQVRGGGGFSTYLKCSTDPDPKAQ